MKKTMAGDKRRIGSEKAGIPGARYYCSRCYSEYDNWWMLCHDDNGTLYPWFKKDWLSRAVIFFSAITILSFAYAMMLPKGTYWTEIERVFWYAHKHAEFFVNSTAGIIISAICIVLMLQEKQWKPALLWPLSLVAGSGVLLYAEWHFVLPRLNRAGPGESIYSFLGPGVLLYFMALFLAILVGVLTFSELLWSGRKFGWRKWEFEGSRYLIRMIMW